MSLYSILRNINQHRITLDTPLLLPGNPVRTVIHITRLAVGYSALIEVHGHRQPVHINKLDSVSIEMITARLQHMFPVNVVVVDKVAQAWVNVYSQIYLS